ncbi:maleylpyruvate isomerase family mycothiol-dependent enzyme [Catellatospora sp. TT07R-123]|uniref:maleylpyruvate isomerase family mycothiol-dependent enzyme n=1 Tax=Catellatospora sp. TT07R-123 TaxID=2733863 RepID=UPI0035B4FC8E
MAERFRVVSLVPDAETVNAALAAEAAALAAGLRAAPEADLDSPTCCPPWSVRDELAHTAVAVWRTLEMLDADPPQALPISTPAYYAPDDRFAPAADSARVAAAHEFAAARTGPQLIDWCEQQCTAVVQRVAATGERLVATRHGDPMRLTDFQVTRVVELAVHGLDLADALGADPWLTPQAADVVTGLLFGHQAGAAAALLGADRADLLRAAMGRTPLTAAQRSGLDALGTTWLATGPS